MESLNFFDLLSQETFELCKSLPSQNPFDDLNPSPVISTLESPSVKINSEIKIEKCGLLYHIDKGINTFCIRGFVSEDVPHILPILKNLELAVDDSSKQCRIELLNILKITNDQDLNSIQFFPTLHPEEAEVIFDQMIGRRFPYNEEILCNLSDPGFSWWMDVGTNRFQIYFKSHGIERSEKLIRLGPIGDAVVAIKHLNRICETLQKLFSINELVCNDKTFALGTSDTDNPHFNSFRDIFWQGKEDQSLNNEIANSIPDANGTTLMLYFREISLLRTFWIDIQKKLRV